jgi:hypothetical protein
LQSQSDREHWDIVVVVTAIVVVVVVLVVDDELMVAMVVTAELADVLLSWLLAADVAAPPSSQYLRNRPYSA